MISPLVKKQNLDFIDPYGLYFENQVRQKAYLIAFPNKMSLL